MDYKKTYEKWLNSETIDQATKDELKNITDQGEIEDRFYKNLEFGTAGLRGIIGAGTNRMNKYTVGKASQALAEVIRDYGKEAMDKGVAIAYDVRNYSDVFSKLAASILAANGVKVYLFEGIRPTPMLSFTIRHLKTQSGIVVTASHNPKNYNGYKVYWEEGAQILDVHANQISEKISKLNFEDINWGSFDDLVDQGKIILIGKEVDEAYYKEVLSREVNDDIDKNVSIVYSPLNGTGNIPVRTVLDRRGFTNINLVEEQTDPDGTFPTIEYPNPEDTKAFEYGLRLAVNIDADIIIATDPDCDRVAMMGKKPDGSYYAFNGNQTGVLLINYILNGLKASDKLPNNGAIVKSIVTGEMAKAICDDFNVQMFSTLTGFKNICSLANIWDQTREYEFIFGYEESIGYTYGDYVRDKDAVISSMLIAEMAGYYKKQGKSLYEVLYDLYEKYGYYKEKLISLTLKGIEGSMRIKKMMDVVRKEPFESIGALKVSNVKDYLTDDPIVGKSNVLEYRLADGSWFSVRPSGTEPKIKLYIYSKDKEEAKAIAKVSLIEEVVLGRLNSIE